MPARPLLAPYGESHIYPAGGQRGRFHSWSYTYFRGEGKQALFIGSLDERSGYTKFDYNFNDGKLLISKDCLDTAVQESYSLFNLYCSFGDLDQAFAAYAALLGGTRPQAPKSSGWCSWYNYYTAVSETIVEQNLAELKVSDLPLDYFQIDDGWQQAIGDWLEANQKFPAGMKDLSVMIKEAGFKPGLWLAPFICVPSSELFRRHPDWLLRDGRGRPVKAGFNPGWEGFFYALDFYNPAVQDYLRRVFSRLQEEWGYSMLKLDFLYAAALLPRQGRSRGQVMTEAIDFIDGQTAGAITLGCGVPLGPAFGRFDYCRIGSDVAPYWEDWLKWLNYPERVAAENSLICTIFRRQLDRRFFRNDPDVYILRDGAKGINLNRLNVRQRSTLLFLNNLLGGLIFFSDRPGELSREQLELISFSYPLCEVELDGFDCSDRLFRFSFSIAEKDYLAFANFNSTRSRAALPRGLWFSERHFLVEGNRPVELEPYDSICFYRVKGVAGEEPLLLGASGHIFPGAQVSAVIRRGDNYRVELRPQTSPGTVVYLTLPEEKERGSVNGKDYPRQVHGRINYIAVPASNLWEDLA